MDEWLRVDLDRGDVGVRIDRVLMRHLTVRPGMSRTRIQKLIAAGDVLINGLAASRVAWRVAAGDDVRVRIAAPGPRSRPAPEPGPLDVLHEDDHLLIVNKPAGVVSHPSFGHASGTLLNALLWHARRDPEAAPALLTRLDKFTSGVVLAAKRPAVFASLQRAMGAHRIEKDYLALVHGRPSPSRGTIDAALDRDPWDRRRIAVTDRGGVPAVTRYERIAVSTIPDGTRPPAPPGGDRAPIHRGIDRRRAWRPPDDPPFLPVSRPDRVRSRSLVSLLKCRLVTGRMHQIRVHLSSRGWPIVGDAAYGSRRSAGHDAPRIGFPRQALHAWRLSLTHPVTREKLVVSAPLPGDMSALMAALGLELDQALEGRGPT